jgi:type IV pilus assembly protein PilN
MRITLNLATRPFIDLGPAIKRLRMAMALLALTACGLGLGLRAFHQKAEQARAREHSLDGQIARVDAEQQGYQNLMREPANAKLLLQIAALNQLFGEKTFSWTLAMEDLETVLPGGVQVSTLEPVRAKDGHITLHLRVLGPRDHVVDLVRNLEHSRHFLLPRIVGENAEASGGPNERLEPVSASNRVNFDLLADYNPAVSGADKAEKSAADADSPDAAPAAQAAPRAGRRIGRPPYTGSSRPAIAVPKPNAGHGGPQ